MTIIDGLVWADATLEILLSLPVREHELVLGKFLASWTLLGVGHRSGPFEKDLSVLEKMERETGIEPATSSLGN